MESNRTSNENQSGLFTALLQDAGRVRKGLVGVLSPQEAEIVWSQWQNCRQSGGSFRYRWSAGSLGQEPKVFDIVANPVDRANPNDSTWIAVETDVTKAVRSEIQAELFEAAVERGWKLDYSVVVFEQHATFLSPRLQHYLKVNPGESDWGSVSESLGMRHLIQAGNQTVSVTEQDRQGTEWTVRMHTATNANLVGRLFSFDKVEIAEPVRDSIQLMDRPTWLFSLDRKLIEKNDAAEGQPEPEVDALLTHLGPANRAVLSTEGGSWEIRRWFGAVIVFFRPAVSTANHVLEAAERLLKRKIEVRDPEAESMSWLRKVPARQQVAVAASLINAIHTRTEFSVSAGEESWSGVPIEGSDEWLIANGANESELSDREESREIDLSTAMAILDTIKRQLASKGTPIQLDAIDQVNQLLIRHRNPR